MLNKALAVIVAAEPPGAGLQICIRVLASGEIGYILLGVVSCMCREQGPDLI